MCVPQQKSHGFEFVVQPTALCLMSVLNATLVVILIPLCAHECCEQAQKQAPCGDGQVCCKKESIQWF